MLILSRKPGESIVVGSPLLPTTTGAAAVVAGWRRCRVVWRGRSKPPALHGRCCVADAWAPRSETPPSKAEARSTADSPVRRSKPDLPHRFFWVQPGIQLMKLSLPKAVWPRISGRVVARRKHPTCGGIPSLGISQ